MHWRLPVPSSWAYSSALAQVSSKKAKWEVPGMEAEDDEYKPMHLTHSQIPLLAMSKHERRAPHQSQLKLKVKGKRFSCPNGANRRASGAKTATTTANGANRRASARSVPGAKSATPTACITSAEMALGLRQTSHGAGHWRFIPSFFFVAVGANFFQRPLAALSLFTHMHMF